MEAMDEEGEGEGEEEGEGKLGHGPPPHQRAQGLHKPFGTPHSDESLSFARQRRFFLYYLREPPRANIASRRNYAGSTAGPR